MDRLVDFLLNYYGPTPYLIVFAILLGCGLGFPMPEDIILFAAGMLTYYGLTNLYWMIFVSMAGVLIGDSIIFFLGATYGRKLTNKWPFKQFLHPERLDSIKQRLHQKGNRLIFAARFMPGLRAPIFFSSGTLHLPYRIFLFYDGLAALISVPAIIGVVYLFGDTVDNAVRWIQRVEHGIVFFILAIILMVIVKWYIGKKRLQKNR